MKRLMVMFLVLAVLTGCGVPDSGPPVKASDENERGGDTSSQVNVVIPQPRPEAGPEETFSGFVAAGGVTQNRARLAETFLTPSARTQFEQGVGVQVVQLNDQPTITIEADQAAMTVSLQVVGSLNEQGSFQQETRSLDLEVRLVRSEGVWLFSAPPPVVVVRESDFQRAFRPVTVYFAAADGAHLIPERRYVDASLRTASLATPIVKMLLAGPSSWLSDAVRLILPTGVRLRGNVTEQNNRLVVDFSPELESAPVEDLNLFAASLGWSLRRYHSGSLQLFVSGRQIAVAGVQAVQDREDWSGYNPSELSLQRLYAVRDGAIRVFGSDKAPAFGGEAGASAVLSAAISLDAQSAAIVRERDDGGQELWVGGASGVGRTLVAGQSIARPTWGLGSVTGLVAVDGFLKSFTRAGELHDVAIDASIGPVRAVRLSFDGARVVLAAGEDDHVRAYVGLVRGREPGEESAVELRSLKPLPAPVASVADVAWVSPTTALVAGFEPEGMAAVWEVEVDASASASTPRNGLRSGDPLVVAAAATEPTAQPVFLQLGDQLFQRFRESWTLAPELSDASAPFYPG